MSDDLVVVTVADGKYTFGQRKSGSCYALRYGEPWREDIFDGLMLAMAHRIEELAATNEDLETKLTGAVAECERIGRLWYDAEAKLAKAVETLQTIDDVIDARSELFTSDRDLRDNVQDRIRIVIAELTGGNDE